MMKGHGGNFRELAAELGCGSKDIYDMSSNINPWGPPPGLVSFIKDNIDSMVSLPDVASDEICKGFAKHLGIDHGLVLAGNGTTQFIYTIPRALNTKKALIIAPTYSDYADSCAMNGSSHTFLITRAADNFVPDMERIKEAASDCDTVFICNPNNPTGVLISKQDLTQLCLGYPDKRFVIDESYLPFVSSTEDLSLSGCALPNVIVLNSMSKIFRIPGLRTGFLISSPEIIKKISKYSLPWSVNALAQAAVNHLINRNAETDIFLQKTRTRVEKEKACFMQGLDGKSGITIYPSRTYFVLAQLTGITGSEVCRKLAEERILIRNCSNFKGLSDSFIRFSLKSNEVNTMLAQKLLSII